jgi:hypothetical protein
MGIIVGIIGSIGIMILTQIIFYLLQPLYWDSLIILDRIGEFIKVTLERDFMLYVLKLLFSPLFYPESYIAILAFIYLIMPLTFKNFIPLPLQIISLSYLGYLVSVFVY